jgi:hypothetical protein
LPFPSLTVGLKSPGPNLCELHPMRGAFRCAIQVIAECAQIYG